MVFASKLSVSAVILAFASLSSAQKVGDTGVAPAGTDIYYGGCISKPLNTKFCDHDYNRILSCKTSRVANVISKNPYSLLPGFASLFKCQDSWRDVMSASGSTASNPTFVTNILFDKAKSTLYSGYCPIKNYSGSNFCMSGNLIATCNGNSWSAYTVPNIAPNGKCGIEMSCYTTSSGGKLTSDCDLLRITQG